MSLKILVITNLYPPQELGGYGRCISDFVSGLLKLGHFVQILSADAPYLHNHTCSTFGLHGEPISRILELKGSYKSGVSLIKNRSTCSHIDFFNIDSLRNHLNCGWDAVLLGNIDLIGTEILPFLLKYQIPILHHIGFIDPPYPVTEFPFSPFYQILPASCAVRKSLVSAGFPVSSAPVIYPGARCDLFRPAYGNVSPSLLSAISTHNSGFSLGSFENPLKVGFAGLLMGSKGVHTIVLALLLLFKNGIYFNVSFAGSEYQDSYRSRLENLFVNAGLSDSYSFVGQLDRHQLSTFWSHHHVGIFPSIYPEAFGISAVEIMASGVVLVSSCVGGSAELFQPGLNGLPFTPDDPVSLANALMGLVRNPSFMFSLASSGSDRAFSSFSVDSSSARIASLIYNFNIN
ncbi:Glycosyltransferase-like [Synechococcus sp. CC9902]|uniref:glycosyltransferase family 4 protein n=1 Tax=Synechococcus sp. (strain CC9902) TaxID=316279 RepID=UPI00005D3D02|nr:glycosyltransferase family 4 protein [Synechococcus sp. CC9902]ABB25080.1 Glycosyltransferase-like [Synechococcus sp. CC9902]